ncbi:hypothetical protein M0R72_10225 [Candidatus Pacearchaeota archaeon]|jgi:hypothetical protein|nr:hypothetical protein [Candidatus Pacearchaeota archaeon]
MKSNAELGYGDVVKVANYCVGKKGNKYRAYGYEWHSEQDASREFAHHVVVGRGGQAKEAIDKMIEMAVVSGGIRENGCDGLCADEAATLRAQLLEELAEIAEIAREQLNELNDLFDALDNTAAALETMLVHHTMSAGDRVQRQRVLDTARAALSKASPDKS